VNANWEEKLKYLGKTCPCATSSTTNPARSNLGSNQGCRGGEPTTNRLSYDTAVQKKSTCCVVCPLFYESASDDYVALMVQRIWKGLETKWSWPNRYFPDFGLEGLQAGSTNISFRKPGVPRPSSAWPPSHLARQTQSLWALSVSSPYSVRWNDTRGLAMNCKVCESGHGLFEISRPSHLETEEIKKTIESFLRSCEICPEPNLFSGILHVISFYVNSFA
jgi:hypothetical protein